MSIKARIKTYLDVARYTIRTMKVAQNGQSNEYAILQTSHRLEKALCYQKIKSGRGHDKAKRLCELVKKEKDNEWPNLFAIETGSAVLQAWTEKMASIGDDVREIQNLMSKYAIIPSGVEDGGYITLKHDEFTDFDSDQIKKLFYSRHSVRNFSREPVSNEDIEEAVKMAMRSPSACNRQATKVYVIPSEVREKAGFENENNADKYLILTGAIDAFSLSEFNDQLISTSIFAGYLNLALHACGIGSCFLRKNIIRKNSYCETIRRVADIPDNEQIIVELAVGYYPENVVVPVSNRKNVNDVIVYVNN